MIAVIAAVNTTRALICILPGTCRTAGVRESGVLLKMILRLSNIALLISNTNTFHIHLSKSRTPLSNTHKSYLRVKRGLEMILNVNCTIFQMCSISVSCLSSVMHTTVSE